MKDFESFARQDPEEALRLLTALRKGLVVPHSAQIPVVESEARFKVMNAGRRTGKSLRCTHPVATPSGWRAIGDLKVGDEVIGSDGRPTKVTGVFPQGVLPTFKLTFRDGSTAHASADHLWKVRTRADRASKVLTTQQLLDRGLKCHRGYKFRVPAVKPVQYPEAELPVPPYLLGALIGDGGLRHSVTFTSADPEILERVVHESRQVDSQLRAAKTAQYGYRLSTPAGRPNKLLEKLRQLELMGKYSHEKTIPAVYMTASVEQRLDLLRGLLDTDGCVNKGNIEFSSSSEALRDQVIELIRSLGGRAYGSSKETTHLTAHRAWGALPDGMNPFHLSRKRDAVCSSGYTMDRAIVSIEPDGEDEHVCISVEAEDKLFVIEHYLCTHNTVIGAKLLIDATLDAPPGSVTWWVAPTYKIVKRGYREVLRQVPRELLKSDPPPDSLFDSGRAVILRFKSGSQIEFYSSERPEGMLGEGVSFVVMDEAATMPARIWQQVVSPTLMDKKGKALLISTPRGRNWFYKLWKRGQDPEAPLWESWTFPTSSNPYIAESEIAEQKAALPKVIFEQEILARFIASGSSVFEWPDNAIQESIVLENGLIEKTPPRDHAFLGIDLARTQDYTVLYGARDYDRRNIYFERFNSVKWSEQKRRIRRAVDKLEAAGATAVTLVMDQTGVGDPIVEELADEGFDVLGINFTSSKYNMVTQLAKDLEQGRAFLLEEMIVEFENYQMGQSEKTKKVTYSAPEGEHDDVVSAKMLSHWGMIQHGNPDAVTGIEGAAVPAAEREKSATEDEKAAADDFSDLLDFDDPVHDMSFDENQSHVNLPSLSERMNNPLLWG